MCSEFLVVASFKLILEFLLWTEWSLVEIGFYVQISCYLEIGKYSFLQCSCNISDRNFNIFLIFFKVFQFYFCCHFVYFCCLFFFSPGDFSTFFLGVFKFCYYILSFVIHLDLHYPAIWIWIQPFFISGKIICIISLFSLF